MMEQALFIRCLLDLSENELVLTTNRFANEYQSILENYSDNRTNLTNIV